MEKELNAYPESRQAIGDEESIEHRVDVKCTYNCTDLEENHWECMSTWDMIRKPSALNLCRTCVILSTQAVPTIQNSLPNDITRDRHQTSVKPKSCSLNLFVLLHQQSPNNEIEVSLWCGIGLLFQSVFWVIAMLFTRVTTGVPTLANVTMSTSRTVHISFHNITNHLFGYFFIGQID
jgi:hypothetical protein